MKKIITTDNAPAPIGPYNQAVLLGDILYTSGQIAINPKTGTLEIEDIESETTLVMENLKAILEAAQMTFENVIKSSIFVSDMHNFSKINEGIVIFDNVECNRCNKSTSYMLDNNINFKIVDISPTEANAKNRDFMQKVIKEKDKNLTQYITPIFIVNGKMSHSHQDLDAFLKSLK